MTVPSVRPQFHPIAQRHICFSFFPTVHTVFITFLFSVSYSLIPTVNIQPHIFYIWYIPHSSTSSFLYRHFQYFSPYPLTLFTPHLSAFTINFNAFLHATLSSCLLSCIFLQLHLIPILQYCINVQSAAVSASTANLKMTIYFAHTIYLCISYISEQTAVISLHSTDWSLLIKEMRLLYEV